MALSTQQIQGLDAASQRKLAGTANATDLANLAYASKQGYAYKAPVQPVTPKIPTGAVAIPSTYTNDKAGQIANYSNIQPVGNTLYGVPKVDLSKNINSNLATTEGAASVSNALAEALKNNQPQTLPTTPDITTQLNDWMTKIQNSYKPTQDLTTAQTNLANAQQSYKQGMNQIEDKTIPMQFITGQQASLQRQFSAEEANLINRLGLAQEAQKQQQAGVEQGFNVFLKAQDLINQEKQTIYNKAQQLTENAKNTLGTILSTIKDAGLSIDKLSADDTAALSELAKQAGIPFGLLTQAARNIYDQNVVAQNQQAELVRAKTTPTRATTGSGRVAPAADVAKSGKLSARAKAVFDNPELLNNYTPSVKGQILDEIINAGLSLPTETPKESTQAKQISTAAADQKTLAESILTHPGLDSSVGPTWLTRTAFFDKFGNKDDFLAKVASLTAMEGLSSLIEAKKQGATFGALTDREMDLLQAAASTLSSRAMRDDSGKVTGYDMSEKAFKEEINRLINSYNKIINEQSSQSTQTPSGLNYNVAGTQTPSGIKYNIIK